MKLEPHLLESLEHIIARGLSLQGSGYNSLGQRFGASWLANEEEGNTQLDAHNHHKDVLPEGCVSSNIRTQSHVVKQYFLTPSGTYKRDQYF